MQQSQHFDVLNANTRERLLFHKKNFTAPTPKRNDICQFLNRSQPRRLSLQRTFDKIKLHHSFFRGYLFSTLVLYHIKIKFQGVFENFSNFDLSGSYKDKNYRFFKKSSQKTFNRVMVNKFRATRVTHFFALVTLVFVAQMQQKPRLATLHIAVLIAKWQRF